MSSTKEGNAHMRPGLYIRLKPFMAEFDLCPMRGLLMMKYYLDEILDGKKDTDARLYPTGTRGTIALVDSATFKVYGLAELTGCDAISYEEFVRWHRVGPFSQTAIAPYHAGKTCYSYRLQNARRIAVPVRIAKDPDAKMWVEIPDSIVKSFSYQRTLF